MTERVEDRRKDKLHPKVFRRWGAFDRRKEPRTPEYYRRFVRMMRERGDW